VSQLIAFFSLMIQVVCNAAPTAPKLAGTCCVEVRACENNPSDRASCVKKIVGCARIVASLARDVDDCAFLSEYGHVPLDRAPRR
jgi:hypothetical protein